MGGAVAAVANCEANRRYIGEYSSWHFFDNSQQVTRCIVIGTEESGIGAKRASHSGEVAGIGDGHCGAHKGVLGRNGDYYDISRLEIVGSADGEGKLLELVQLGRIAA